MKKHMKTCHKPSFNIRITEYNDYHKSLLEKVRHFDGTAKSNFNYIVQNLPFSGKSCAF